VLNALELAVETTEADENGRIHLTLEVAEESIQRRAVLYDKEGDVHYDTISAFIKSVRGSDPDAALYWMAKMVYAGEDPRFIFRRMTILAGEDIGLADPQAMGVVTSCWQAFERIGMPEGRFPLAQACIYLATAPKSNSAFAFFDALTTIEKEQEADVPNHLKDGNRDSEGFGHGKGYLYPHAYRDHWVAQQYLPDGLQGKMFYEPSDQGYERQIQLDVARKREAQLAAMLEAGNQQEIGEIYTTSPKNRNKEAWLQRTISQAGQSLGQQRERLFELAAVQRHHLVLDVNAGSGLLTWEALRHAPEGGVWALAAATTDGEALRQQAERLPELERPSILLGDLTDLNTLLALRGEEELRFDRIIGRNLFTINDTSASLSTSFGLTIGEVGKILWERLLEDGRFCLIQTIPKRGQRLYKLVNWSGETKALHKKVQKAEEAIYTDESDPLVNWDESDLQAGLEAAGFSNTSIQLAHEKKQRQLTTVHLARWFGDSGNGTYGQRLLDGGLSEKEVAKVATLYRRQLQEQIVGWETAVVYLIAFSASE